jgi:CofD-related protein of GAK system
MNRPTYRVSVHRQGIVPDSARIERCRRLPEFGPHLLFFSGGSALLETSRVLKSYTHNSIHLITPFDSGGSSAVLREAFSILGVGDLRNRLMSLADESVLGEPDAGALFSHRLSTDASAAELLEQLGCLLDGTHLLVETVEAPLRAIVLAYLGRFAQDMPKEFDLRGASVGNLILAGGYLVNQRDLETVLYQFSKLVGVRGTVRPTATAYAHLVAIHEGGARTVGQHHMGGSACLERGTIRSLELTSALEDGDTLELEADRTSLRLIARADLIVFPMGSFYGSVLANLLPRQVGRAILAHGCPRVYVPNCGRDPEMAGHTVAHCVERIAEAVSLDAEKYVAPAEVLDFIVVDSLGLYYHSPIDFEHLKELGLTVLDVDLADPSGAQIDPLKLTKILLSLA